NIDQGQIVTAFEIIFPIRSEGFTIPYYWRIQVNSATLISDWTDTQTFTRDLSNKFLIANRLFGNYPDKYFYEKDVKSNNTYTFAENYAREIEELDFEVIRIKRDNYLVSVRDDSLYNNFGILYDFIQSNQTNQEYREQLIQLKKAFNSSSTFGAIQTIVSIFTCVEPTIQNVSNITGWRLYSKADTRPNKQNYYLMTPGGPTPFARLFNKASKAHAFYLTISNPFGLIINEDYLENLIYELIPAEVKVNFIFS